MIKFLKSLLCLTLVFLILAEPCFALGFAPVNPTIAPVLPRTNFTVKTDSLNKLLYSQSLPNLIKPCSKIGEGSNSCRHLCFRRKDWRDLANLLSANWRTLSFRKVRTHLTYDYLNRLLNLTNKAYNLKKIGLNTNDLESEYASAKNIGGSAYGGNDRELLAQQDIRESGTRKSGKPENRDKFVPDNQISQSSSPGSPDNQMSYKNILSILSDCLFPNAYAQPVIVAQPLPLYRLISKFDYTYDDVGNRLTMDEKRGTSAPAQTSYVYDNIYQLTQVSGAQVHSYDYDTVGNREIVDGTTYTANNLNQYTNVGGVTYTNDQNGNSDQSVENYQIIEERILVDLVD